MKDLYTQQVENPKGRLGQKKDIPMDWKSEKTVQEKLGIKAYDYVRSSRRLPISRRLIILIGSYQAPHKLGWHSIHKASAGTFSSRYKSRKVLIQSHCHILSMRPSNIYTPQRVEATKVLISASPNRSYFPQPSSFGEPTSIFPSQIL